MPNGNGIVYIAEQKTQSFMEGRKYENLLTKMQWMRLHGNSAIALWNVGQHRTLPEVRRSDGEEMSKIDEILDEVFCEEKSNKEAKQALRDAVIEALENTPIIFSNHILSTGKSCGYECTPTEEAIEELFK